SSSALKMPSPIIVFKDVFKFMELKALSRAGRQNDVYMLAEGLIDGKVVAVHKVVPSRQPVKLQLRIDDDSTTLKADGSDVVTVIAELTDKDGVVKRLNNFSVKFTVEGEGRLLSDTTWSKNVVKVSWGSAPIMLQSTTKAGAIKIRAELSHKGINAIAPAEIIYKSVKSDMKFINGDDVNANSKVQNTLSSEKELIDDLIEENSRLKKVIADEELRKVENQQES
ncbi:MAG: glycoside hydrolase family 2 protein, partial [Rikenellaceae bacterium]